MERLPPAETYARLEGGKRNWEHITEEKTSTITTNSYINAVLLTQSDTRSISPLKLSPSATTTGEGVCGSPTVHVCISHAANRGNKPMPPTVGDGYVVRLENCPPEV